MLLDVLYCYDVCTPLIDFNGLGKKDFVLQKIATKKYIVQGYYEFETFRQPI